MMKTLAAAALMVTTMVSATPATSTPASVAGNYNINGVNFGPVLSTCQLLLPHSRACAAGNHPSTQQPQTRQPGVSPSHQAAQRRPTRR